MLGQDPAEQSDFPPQNNCNKLYLQMGKEEGFDGGGLRSVSDVNHMAPETRTRSFPNTSGESPRRSKDRLFAPNYKVGIDGLRGVSDFVVEICSARRPAAKQGGIPTALWFAENELMKVKTKVGLILNFMLIYYWCHS